MHRQRGGWGSALLVCGAILCCGGAPARAEVEWPKDRAAAESDYAAGTRLYELGDYRAALASFKKAYLEYDAPAFLYNIARCHERLGERELAIDRYQAFLSREPESPDRPAIEAQIASLRAELAAAPKRRPIYKRWWLWTTLGVVAVGAGLGVGLGLGLRPHAPDAHFSGVTAF